MQAKPLTLSLKGLRLASLAVIAVLALSACSSNNTSNSSGVPATGSTPTTASNYSAPTTAATSASGGATSAPTTAATMSATSGATMSATSGATMSATSGATTAASGTTNTPAATVTLTVKTDSKLGSYLADDKGMTVYMYTKDSPGKSTCEGQCATIWPPVLVASGGKVTVSGGGDQTLVGTITRSDGTTQVTYRNLPLYYFSKDKAPGDTTGQGVGTVWYVVKP